MKLPRREFLRLAGAAAALPAAPRAGLAQSYPTRPVRWIVPYPAGGATDLISRLMGQWLTERLGQPVIVDNRPGGGTNIGTQAVVSSPPDGYTLLFTASTHTINVSLQQLPFNFLRDITLVSGLTELPLVMDVSPKLPVKNLKEFISLAKKRPGELTYGSSGNGATGHIAAEMLSQHAGIKLMHIPYKGNAPATTDLVGGHIMLMFDQVSTSAGYIKSGRLRALGVTSKKRSPLFPDLPTVDESGIKGFEDTTFNGLVAPAGTPRPVLEKLRGTVVKAIAVPALQNRFDGLGIPLVASASLDDYNAYLRRHVEDFSRLAKTAGLKAN